MAEPLRERTRRAVRAELSEAAQDLFMQHGYEATTVEQIAAAAGISRRSFFRYFTAKDDVVLDKYELLGDQLADAVASRPPAEPAWDSLRRAFDVVVAYYMDDQRRARAAMMQDIVDGSPALQARFLQKWGSIQQRLADVLQQRGAVDDPIVAHAMVAAATSCLSGAVAKALATENVDSLPQTIDQAMTRLRPVSAQRGRAAKSPAL